MPSKLQPPRGSPLHAYSAALDSRHVEGESAGLVGRRLRVAAPRPKCAAGSVYPSVGSGFARPTNCRRRARTLPPSNLICPSYRIRRSGCATRYARNRASPEIGRKTCRGGPADIRPCNVCLVPREYVRYRRKRRSACRPGSRRAAWCGDVWGGDARARNCGGTGSGTRHGSRIPVRYSASWFIAHVRARGRTVHVVGTNRPALAPPARGA